MRKNHVKVAAIEAQMADGPQECGKWPRIAPFRKKVANHHHSSDNATFRLEIQQLRSENQDFRTEVETIKFKRGFVMNLERQTKITLLFCHTRPNHPNR